VCSVVIEPAAWEWLRGVHAALLPEADEALFNRIESEQNILDHHEGWRENMLTSHCPPGWSNEGVASYVMALHWCVSRIVEGWRHHPGFDQGWLE
jgi:hypothetical protein